MKNERERKKIETVPGWVACGERYMAETEQKAETILNSIDGRKTPLAVMQHTINVGSSETLLDIKVFESIRNAERGAFHVFAGLCLIF